MTVDAFTVAARVLSAPGMLSVFGTTLIMAAGFIVGSWRPTARWQYLIVGIVCVGLIFLGRSAQTVGDKIREGGSDVG